MNPATNPNAVTGPTTSLDAYVPTLDFDTVADLAQHTSGAQFLWAGGTAVGVGFAVRMLISQWNKRKTGKFDAATPVAHLVFWLTVGASYKLISVVTITTVTALGLMQSDSASDVTEVFARRYAGFLAHQEYHNASGITSMLTATGWKVASMELVVHLSWVLATVLIFGIKSMQVVLLQDIVTLGPILLGLASLGVFFHVLGVSWFWSLFEVSMWSVSMGIFLACLNGFAARLPQDFSWVVQLLVSAFTIMGIAMTLGVTAMLVRGNSAGSVGRDMGHTALALSRLSTAVHGFSTGKLLKTITNPSGKAARMEKAGKAGLAAGRAIATKTAGLFLRGASGTSSGTRGSDNSGVAASARRKQQTKHFAIKARRKEGK